MKGTQGTFDNYLHDGPRRPEWSSASEVSRRTPRGDDAENSSKRSQVGTQPPETLLTFTHIPNDSRRTVADGSFLLPRCLGVGWSGGRGRMRRRTGKDHPSSLTARLQARRSGEVTEWCRAPISGPGRVGPSGSEEAGSHQDAMWRHWEGGFMLTSEKRPGPACNGGGSKATSGNPGRADSGSMLPSALPGAGQPRPLHLRQRDA